MPDSDRQRKLKREEIRFLALEGGGGKGFAYLGAIEVLEEKQVMDHVEGVSGTSAGAITALMLALGMTAAEIRQELTTNDFTKFFDPPTEGGPVERGGLRLVPRPVKYAEQSTTACERTMLKGWNPADVVKGAARGALGPPGDQGISPLVSLLGPLALGIPLIGSITGGVAGVLGPLLTCLGQQPSLLAKVAQTYAWLLSGPGDLNRKIIQAANILGDALVPDARAVLDRLLPRLPEYLTFLDRDMGLFSGVAARGYFEGLIAKRLEAKLGKRRADALKNLTFGQLAELKTDLGARDFLVCGANLSLGRSVLFSWKHTPAFPIADAVRISMSLPIVYKPYIVPQSEKGYPPCGTYVDGGLWNNLPFREIGDLAAAAPTNPPAGGQTPESPSAEDRQGLVRALNAALNQRATLGLRLEIVPPATVFSAGDVIAKSFIVAGETRILPDLDPFTQILDTTDLALLQFKPPDSVQDVVTKRSRRAMLSYFDETPAMDPNEEADERDVKARRAVSLCTGPSGEMAPIPVMGFNGRSSSPSQGRTRSF
jgi:predicted acylesterase/phospholipase RssA